MAHKKKPGAPVPPGNRSHTGPKDDIATPMKPAEGEVASDQEQDIKHRMGDFEGKADHSIQQPGGKGGANH